MTSRLKKKRGNCIFVKLEAFIIMGKNEEHTNKMKKETLLTIVHVEQETLPATNYILEKERKKNKVKLRCQRV